MEPMDRLDVFQPPKRIGASPGRAVCWMKSVQQCSPLQHSDYSHVCHTSAECDSTVSWSWNVMERSHAPSLLALSTIAHFCSDLKGRFAVGLRRRFTWLVPTSWNTINEICIDFDGKSRRCEPTGSTGLCGGLQPWQRTGPSDARVKQQQHFHPPRVTQEGAR